MSHSRSELRPWTPISASDLASRAKEINVTVTLVVFHNLLVLSSLMTTVLPIVNVLYKHTSEKALFVTRYLITCCDEYRRCLSTVC